MLCVHTIQVHSSNRLHCTLSYHLKFIYRYPLYQRGNPQLRIFLPNFWMKLLKPKQSQPRNMVQFMVSVEMTDHDVKNYLEKIYKVPVVDVRTQIFAGMLKVLLTVKQF